MDFALLELLDTPLFWMNEQGTIIWHNSAAQTLLDLKDYERLWSNICHHLPDGYIYRLHVCALESVLGTLVECMPDANPELTVELQRLQAANGELERIFNASFDEVFVTDGNGVTLRVNEAAERLYGLTQKELVGQTVYELERQRVFYPSVTAMTLREKKRLTILQSTLDGRRLLTTANPIFDQEGNIILVISNAKDMSDVPLTVGQIADFRGVPAAPLATPDSAVHATIAASSPA
ncbi:MAG: PAS domain-containing protein, partial [Bacilli bacterium]